MPLKGKAQKMPQARQAVPGTLYSRHDEHSCHARRWQLWSVAVGIE